MKFDIGVEPPSTQAIAEYRVQTRRRMLMTRYASLGFLMITFFISLVGPQNVSVSFMVSLCAMIISVFTLMEYVDKLKLLKDIDMDHIPKQCSEFAQACKYSDGVKIYHEKLLKIKRRPIVMELYAAKRYEKWEQHKKADEKLHSRLVTSK